MNLAKFGKKTTIAVFLLVTSALCQNLRTQTVTTNAALRNVIPSLGVTIDKIVIECGSGMLNVDPIWIDGKNNWEIQINGTLMSDPSVLNPDNGYAGDDGGANSVFRITNSANFKIYGDRIVNAKRQAVYVTDSKYFDVSIGRIGGTRENTKQHSVLFNYCSNFTFKNSSIDAATIDLKTDTRADKGNAICVFNSNSFTISNCKIRNNRTNGIYVADNSFDFKILQNVISRNSMSGVHIATTNNEFFPSNFLISGNSINDNVADGIDINNEFAGFPNRDINAVISNNTFSRNGFDLFGNPTRDGSGIGTYRNVRNFTVSGNYSIGSANSGAYITFCRKFTISGNRIIRDQKNSYGIGKNSGIYLGRSDSGTISGNYVEMKTPSNVFLSYSDDGSDSAFNTNITFLGNTFSGDVAIIEFSGINYSGSKFINNYVVSKRNIDVYMPFSGNTLLVTTPPSSTVEPGNVLIRTDMPFESNNVFGAKYAVRAFAENAKIYNNFIKGADEGLHCENINKVFVDRNVIQGGTGAGARFLNCTCAVIINNTFIAGSANSIRIDGAKSGVVKQNNVVYGFPEW